MVQIYVDILVVSLGSFNKLSQQGRTAVGNYGVIRTMTSRELRALVEEEGSIVYLLGLGYLYVVGKR